MSGSGPRRRQEKACAAIGQNQGWISLLAIRPRHIRFAAGYNRVRTHLLRRSTIIAAVIRASIQDVLSFRRTDLGGQVGSHCLVLRLCR